MNAWDEPYKTDQERLEEAGATVTHIPARRGPQREITLAQPSEPFSLPQPPSCTEAEQALLGAILVNNAMYQRVVDRLEPIHFGAAVHGRIYEAIGGMIDAGGLADVQTIARFFAKDPDLVNLGGAQYIGRLAASVVTMINSSFYADTIVDTWRRREIIARAWLAIHDAAEPQPDRDALVIAQELEDGLSGLAESDSGDGKPLMLRDAMIQAQAATEEAVKRGGAGGLATGLSDLDSKIVGMFPKHLIIVGGRPGMGKSAFAQGIASSVARRGGPVAYFTQEMSNTDIGWREIAACADISTEDQMSGKLDLNSIMRTSDAITDIGDAPLFLFEKGSTSLAEVARNCRSIKRRHGLALAVIDHLQLMRTRGRSENRRLELGAITGGLKALAKELGIPIMLLSQLSREVEKRDDKRPIMSDLRETGDIEQDADTVWFLYREEYYLTLAGPPARKDNEKDDVFALRTQTYYTNLARCGGYAEVIIPKVRYGKTGQVRLRFSGSRTRFSGLDGAS